MSFQIITVQEAKSFLDAEQAIFVDIRDPGSFAEAHIEKALRIDDGNIEEFLNHADRSRPLICYCYHGISSQSAAEYFRHQGFEKVYSLEGGFEAWRAVFTQ